MRHDQLWIYYAGLNSDLRVTMFFNITPGIPFDMSIQAAGNTIVHNMPGFMDNYGNFTEMKSPSEAYMVPFYMKHTKDLAYWGH